MNNFEYYSPTRIFFGRGEHRRIGEIAGRYAPKVLLHYGRGHIKKTGLYDEVCTSLKAAGVEFEELGGVEPNPRLSLVREGIDLCRKKEIGFVLAVGGGSVIDSAKAVAMGVPYEGDVWDFFLKKAELKEALPTGNILTIAAAGSEASKSVVITKDDEKLKRPVNDEKVRPVFSIMNPELTFTLPPYQTACGIVDMAAHIIERYFTADKNVELTDKLCEAALRTIINNAPKVMTDPENYDARAELMWAGTLAHNDLLSTGRTGDFGSHLIEHELSALYDLAHGAGLAIIFPAWMKYVYRKDPERFVQFAVEVWKVDYPLSDSTAVIREGIRKMEDFFRSLGMPVRFKDADLPDSSLNTMAEKAVKFGPVGNTIRLSKEDVLEIYKLAL